MSAWPYIHGLVHDCGISSADAPGVQQFCTEPYITYISDYEWGHMSLVPLPGICGRAQPSTSFAGTAMTFSAAHDPS